MRWKQNYADANRLDPGQPLSNSVADLRSNLFATLSIFPNQLQADFLWIWTADNTWDLYLKNYPAFKESKIAYHAVVDVMWG